MNTDDLLSALRAIKTDQVSPAPLDQVIELATVLGEAIRRNISQPKSKLFEELRLFAEECSKVEDRHAIGLAVYAFIAAREGDKKA